MGLATREREQISARRRRILGCAMYVGKSHTATITSRGVRTFVCPSCSHEALAIVVGVGQGAGQSPFFLDEEGAKERASREGAKNAEENAAFTLSLARCPKCFWRDDRKIALEKAKAMAGALACVLVFPLFGLLLDASHSGRSSAGLFIFVPLGFFTAFFVFVSQRWKWETVENRVHFLSDEELDALGALTGDAKPRS